MIDDSHLLLIGGRPHIVIPAALPNFLSPYMVVPVPAARCLSSDPMAGGDRRRYNQTGIESRCRLPKSVEQLHAIGGVDSTCSYTV